MRGRQTTRIWAHLSTTDRDAPCVRKRRDGGSLRSALRVCRAARLLDSGPPFLQADSTPHQGRLTVLASWSPRVTAAAWRERLTFEGRATSPRAATASIAGLRSSSVCSPILHFSPTSYPAPAALLA